MNKKKPINILRALALAFSGIATSVSAQDSTVELDPFLVEASEDSGVVAIESISATRFASRLDELPFAVNVLTEELLSDISVTDMRDAVQFAGGVINGGRGFNTSANNRYRIRGFPTNGNLINGFSVSQDFNIAPNSIQRVEVVKGPASLLYGATPPGGIVNFITKRPTADKRASLRYIHGSYDFNRIDIDTSGPLTDDIRYLVTISQEDREFFQHGTTRNALHFNPQMEFDFAEKKGNILVDYYYSDTDEEAVISAPPTTRNTAMDEYGRFAHEVDEDYPVLDFNVRDVGAPVHNESDSIFIRGRYWFNDNYTLRVAYRTQHGDRVLINQATAGLPFFVEGNPNNPPPLQITDPGYGIANAPFWDSNRNSDSAKNLQLNLLINYDFEWGSFQFMPGFDYNEQQSWFSRFRAGTIGDDGRRSGNFRSPSTKQIFDPNTWIWEAPPSSSYIVDDPRTEAYEGPGLLRNNSGNDGSSEDFYLYGSGNFFEDNLIVTFGFRDSSFENSLTTTDETRHPQSQSELNFSDPLTGEDSIYQYGAVYKLIPDKLHLYGNFAQSFQPQLRTIQLPDSDNNPLDTDLDGDGRNDAPLLNDNPRVPADHLFGEGWEAGIKGTLGGEDSIFSYAIAYFTVTNNNIIRNITVSENPDSYLPWFPNLSAEDRALIDLLPDNERIDEFQIQSGEEEAKGYEFELTATPVEGWDIRATYTILDTQLLRDPSSPQAEGRVLPNSPEDNFNVFTRYAFGGRLDGFFIGGSADYFSERFSGAPQAGHAGLRARPRTLINAFAGYRIQSGDLLYRFQLNGSNLTDVIDTQGDNLVGLITPRSYRLTVGVDF